MLLEAFLQATTGLEHTARPIAARCPRCHSGGVYNRDVRVGSRHAWVQFGCSGGGTTAGTAYADGARPTRHCAWRRISRPVTALARCGGGTRRDHHVPRGSQAVSRIWPVFRWEARRCARKLNGSALNWKASNAARWRLSNRRMNHQLRSMRQHLESWWSNTDGVMVHYRDRHLTAH